MKQFCIHGLADSAICPDCAIDHKNGWTAESLAAYRRERDKVADVVSGNVVTEFKRPKPSMKIEGGGRNYSPFTRQVVR